VREVKMLIVMIEPTVKSPASTLKVPITAAAI